MRKQCVLRIADLSLECGDISRAIAVLTEECATDPANEDLAFHVMDVQARLGRYPEALAQYTQLEAALLERGAVPQEETKRLGLWLRAQGVTKYFSSWPSLVLSRIPRLRDSTSLFPDNYRYNRGICKHTGGSKWSEWFASYRST